MVDPSRNCPFCGGAIPLGSPRCPSCGNENIPNQGPVQMSPAAPQPQPSSSSGGSAGGVTIIVSLLVFALMAAGGVGYFLMASSEPVVEAYAPSVAPPSAPPSSMPFSPSSSVTLRINVEPAGAQVLIDGSVAGMSPLVIQRPRGETPLRIEARMPGYHSAQQTIVPQNDTVLALTLARDNSLGGGGASPNPPVAQTAGAPVANSGANASAASPEVHGSLPREVIQRVMRRHLSSIRGCYERQLIQNPNLVGRVAIRFVIASDGRVSSANVASTTVNNPDMEQCLVRAVQRIRFPQPEGGGVVIVTYPFVFQSAE